MKPFFLCLISVIFVLTSCTNDGSTPIGAIYSSGEFTVYPDSVTVNGATITATTCDLDDRLPKYHSDQPIIDALFALAIKDIYSTTNTASDLDIFMSLAALTPQKAATQLKAKIKSARDGIILSQLSSPENSWPITTDGISCATAIWETYNTTGDKDLISEALPAIESTLNLNMRVAWNESYNLIKGKSGNSPANYPEWTRPVDLFQSMSLGTNVLFANAFKVRDLICQELRNTTFTPLWAGIDREITTAINTTLWIPSSGFYGQYLYGGVYPILSPSNDNFAQALAIIFDTANPEMAKSIVMHTPTTPEGILPSYPLSHGSDTGAGLNDASTTQALWNIAAAKARNITAVELGLASTLFHGALYAAGKGAFSCSNQDNIPSKNSGEWSSAGMAALILRVIAGMEFTGSGIAFNPIVPASLPGEKTLSRLRYKNSTLSIKIYGTGESVKTFSINGTPQADCFLPDSINGDVSVEIIMDNRPHKKIDIEIKPSERIPETPLIEWKSPEFCQIENYDSNSKYQTFVNGDYPDIHKTDTISFVPKGGYTSVNIVPVDKNGLTGFSAPTHEYIDPKNVIIIPSSTMSAAGTALIADRKLAKNFVETTVEYNTSLYFNVNAPESGDYLFDVSYTNGNGPVNHGDKCAIRMLYIEGAEVGAVIMPQQGEGNWDSPDFSNMLPIRLNKGVNHLSLKYVIDNMDRENNTALIEYARIIKQ